MKRQVQEGPPRSREGALPPQTVRATHSSASPRTPAIREPVPTSRKSGLGAVEPVIAGFEAVPAKTPEREVAGERQRAAKMIDAALPLRLALHPRRAPDAGAGIVAKSTLDVRPVR